MPSELRRGRPVRFWRCAALGVFAMLLLAPAASRAQSSRSLRARLEALRSEAPAPLPEGALLSIEHTIDVAERIEGRFPERTPEWRRLASTYLDRAEEGVDPFSEARGKIVERGYRSTLSPVLQGYAVYIPPDYDPSRRYPLYIALHGGSSNGNLFLGVLLGNNMDWLTYDQHLWDEYTARWTPDWIVVAPTGFGQVMWRWMGEQDVLDVLADVERHYPIDADRVVLGGLSNGGVGAYAIGMRHAWRFAAVQAMAGAPSWSQYVGGGLAPEERLEVRRYSGLDLAENTAMTDFRYYHGRTDTGPMRPPYVEEFSRRLARLGLPRNETWLEAGHDILYRVHRHGRVYSELAGVRRDRRPQEVRLVSGDYRAARQHWLEISRLERFPELGRAHARVEGATLRIETEGVQALQLHLRDCPLEGESIRLEFDGALAYEGPLGALGDVLHLRRGAEGWETGFPQDPEGLFKGPGRSGPISDAYYGRMVHVYGTQNEDHTDALRRAAERGARGWPLWAWDLRQEVVADTSVDQALAASAHLVLYGSPGDNAVLERLSASLPIQIEEGAVRVGERRHEGRDVGVRFVYPNPMATDRYVIVQAGTTPEVVALGNKLAEFLPDYIVYDARTVAGAQRRVSGRTRPRAMGWFDSRWRLPTETDATAGAGAALSTPPPGRALSRVRRAGLGGSEGAGPDQGGGVVALLPIPEAPPLPERPSRYLAPYSDQAGRAARIIGRRVPTFENYRAAIAGASWRTRSRASWRVRPTEACLEDLRARGVPFRPRPDAGRPVPNPVEILGPIEGVWFRAIHEDQPLLLSCEMAVRLPALVAVLAEHGVRGVDVMSSYRDHPRTSFHTMGLALDLPRFWTDRGWLSVERDFEATPGHQTCDAPRPSTWRARALLGIACGLSRTSLFSSVLTPNYNEGHRDHFHIDARPADPRLFLR